MSVDTKALANYLIEGLRLLSTESRINMRSGALIAPDLSSYPLQS